MTIFGVVIEEDIGHDDDPEKERWIGKGVKALIDQARLTFIETAPPQKFAGQFETDLSTVPALIQHFGDKINFFDQFPDQVSTTHTCFRTDDPKEQVNYDEEMERTLGESNSEDTYINKDM